jgi:TRAP-type C4-dicarboxylate transport system substrate-binding protein
MAKSLGAGVVATPAVKSNEIISRGVVDAHLGLGGDAIQAFQIIPYTKSMTKFSKPIYTTTFSFVINKDKWAEISAEDQAAIKAISQDKIGMTASAKWDSVSAGVYARFGELGISVHDADASLEQALMNAAEPVTGAWKAKANAAGIDADAALAFYEQRVAEISK